MSEPNKSESMSTFWKIMIVVAVPIIVAIITIMPKLMENSGKSPAPATVVNQSSKSGSNFNNISGNVTTTDAVEEKDKP